MIDLKKISGLPIEIQDDYTLKFHSPLEQVEANVRTIKDMQSVLLDPHASSTRDEMYYMYRDVHLPEDAEKIKASGVTYDITVIPPARIGEEFNKTIGHYHGIQPGTGLAYPEVYEVLHGHALFFLQKMDPEYKRVITVATMEAKAGEKVIYPPNYGHIIVNIGTSVLVTGNWVGKNFERMYDQVGKMRGMDYYVVHDGEHGYKFVPNHSYKDHPEIRQLTNKFMGNFGIMHKGPMYTIGVSDPGTLEFLNNPYKFAVELSSITS